MKIRRFVDCVTVEVRAGKGGDGSASFRREAHVPRGGPDGGDGGRGGHVIFRGNRNENSLGRLFFDNRIVAEAGVPGRGQRMHGRNGADRLVDLPCGTLIYNDENDLLLGDITTHGQELVVARGGRGGLGNLRFTSSTRQAPTESTPGRTGEAFRLRLELKVIADLGLVGFPNAGKSSLLAALSEARPKIAAYPFTTLNPVIGTLPFDDGSSVTIADIPGIVEGAHAGIGLGIEFLRHIARAQALIFVVDLAGSDGRQPWDDYRALRTEIRRYDAALLQRPTIVVANKLDLPAAAENLERFTRAARRRILPLSTQNGVGLDQLRQQIQTLTKPQVPGQTTATNIKAISRSGHEVITPDRLAGASFLALETKSKRRKQR